MCLIRKEFFFKVCWLKLENPSVGGDILPGFCEDGKANVGSSREGRPEKDKNIQNTETRLGSPGFNRPSLCQKPTLHHYNC